MRCSPNRALGLGKRSNAEKNVYPLNNKEYEVCICYMHMCIDSWCRIQERQSKKISNDQLYFIRQMLTYMVSSIYNHVVTLSGLKIPNIFILLSPCSFDTMRFDTKLETENRSFQS